MSISHYYNFVRYKIETVLSGETVEKFCFRNGIPYNFFRNGIEIRVTKIAPRNLHPSYAGEILYHVFSETSLEKSYSVDGIMRICWR